MQILIWLLPPLLYLFMVMFFRRQVDRPHIQRIFYLGTFIMMIPIMGWVLLCVLIGLLIGGYIMEEITFKKGTKFSKRWLD